jgi:hypothetical protein
MMSLRQVAGFAAAALLVAATAADALGQRAPQPNFTVMSSEVWSETGLRVLDDALLVEPTGQRSRVRLLTRDSAEIIVEGSTFMVMNGGPKGIIIKSVGGATVTSTTTKRRMEAHSVEVGLSPEGWGYFKAVRHPI